ncbi:MAG TPA: hypothetical protein VMO26_16725 [Vicinamibacterales bacterium]|nr:hypothetical protein [Vicinamibacterales bacterium]
MKPAAVALLLLGALSTVSAQNTSGPPLEAPDDPKVYRTTGTRIAIGRSIQVAVDEEVTDTVVVVGGSLRVDGRVRDGVVVVGGNLDVGPRSDVRGEVVVVGGRINREGGAQIRGRVSDISFGDWSTWTLGGLSMPVVDFGDFGRWVTLFGTLFRVAFLALLMWLVILAARAPVARIGRSAAAEPGRAFALGLVAELLFLPALIIGSFALIITIIGIPLVALLVPLAMIAAFVALILGFTALACRIGEWVEDRLGWRADSAVLATTIGLLLILGPTMIARVVAVAPAPLQFAGWGLLLTGILIEFVVWTTGLGATLMTGFGRWSTAPPRPPAVPQTHIVPVTN